MKRTIPLSNLNKAVTFKNGVLHFGDVPVVESSAREGDDSIPALYVIRLLPDYRLATTMDLTPNGFIWLCSFLIKGLYENQQQKAMPQSWHKDFDAIKRILDNLNNDTAGKQWAIFEEEDFSQYDES